MCANSGDVAQNMSAFGAMGDVLVYSLLRLCAYCGMTVVWCHCSHYPLDHGIVHRCILTSFWTRLSTRCSHSLAALQTWFVETAHSSKRFIYKWYREQVFPLAWPYCSFKTMALEARYHFSNVRSRLVTRIGMCAQGVKESSACFRFVPKCIERSEIRISVLHVRFK